MPTTADSLRVVLANMFTLYYCTHTFHWNVQGILFASIHKYFDDLYNQLWESIDPIAEHIRALGELAPGSLEGLLSRATFHYDGSIPGTPREMIEELSSGNKHLILSMYTAHEVAEKENQAGVLNFLEGLIDAHEKIQWQLTSHLVL